MPNAQGYVVTTQRRFFAIRPQATNLCGSLVADKNIPNRLGSLGEIDFAAGSCQPLREPFKSRGEVGRGSGHVRLMARIRNTPSVSNDEFINVRYANQLK